MAQEPYRFDNEWWQWPQLDIRIGLPYTVIDKVGVTRISTTARLTVNGTSFTEDMFAGPENYDHSKADLG